MYFIFTKFMFIFSFKGKPAGDEVPLHIFFLSWYTTGRLLLNYRGNAFDRLFKSFVWRLDDKLFIVLFLFRQSEPEDADQ